MEYIEYKPSPFLAPFISHYFIMETKTEDGLMPPFKVSPTGHAYFTFILGAPWRAYMGAKIKEDVFATLNGQLCQKNVYIQPQGAGRLIGIDFHPMAITNIFGLNMELFTDTVTDLQDALDEDIQLLYQKLIEQPSLPVQIQMLEFWLFKKLQNKKKEIAPHIVETIHNIKQTRGNISLQEISGNLKLSLRTLERNFKSWVGLSPKQFNQIIRVNYILKAMHFNPDLDLDYYLEKANFYDRPHFSRVFKQVTGFSPNAYMKQRVSLEKHFVGR